MPAPQESSVVLEPAGAATPMLRFCFDERDGGPAFVVPLRPLDAIRSEVWHSRAVLDQGRRDGIAYVCDGQYLIGQLRLDPAQSEDIESAAEQAYARLLAFLPGCGYPQLLRTWNYFDRLNEGPGDSERYRRFCVGRLRAIAVPSFEARLPAATVIGAQVPGLVLHFLAGRTSGVQVENPRQTSAFRYPRDYGPASPSFSRATLVGRHLLVSGTAAVVGHVTRHPEDARAQVDEILANLRALLAHAAAQHLNGVAGHWTAQALRVYLRDPADAAVLLPRLAQAEPTRAPIAVLRGDISRADLMVEIEGVWTFAG
jgi:chorismate lyase/3-hydroxybenzoate synthase